MSKQFSMIDFVNMEKYYLIYSNSLPHHLPSLWYGSVHVVVIIAIQLTNTNTTHVLTIIFHRIATMVNKLIIDDC
jgi:hypothetical protein